MDVVCPEHQNAATNHSSLNGFPEQNGLSEDGTPPKKRTTFEDILKVLGEVEKFQMIQCTLAMSPLLLLAFMTLGFVFIGYTPPHQCEKVNETDLLIKNNLYNDSTAKISYGQCEVTVTSNVSGQMKEVLSLRCPNGYHYPGGKYMTLVSEWDLVCDKTGVAETAQLLFTIGNILGGLFVPAIADRFGRKPLVCITVTINMLIEFGLAFAPNMYVMCSVLFIDGIIYSGVTAVYYILGMEILVAKYRQVFGVVACQYWVLSIMFVGLVGYLSEDLGWRYFQATGSVPGLVILPMFFFLYESPRWLAINGRGKEALAILKKASKMNGKDFMKVKKVFDDYMSEITIHKKSHGMDIDDEELSQMPLTDIHAKKVNEDTSTSKGRLEDDETTYTIKEMDYKKLEKVSLINMLMKKDTLILLLVIWYMWTTCNLTYYGIYMSSSDLAGNRFLNFCLLAIVEIPANFIVLYMMNRMGRLQVVRIFLVLASLSLLASLLLRQFFQGYTGSDIASVVLFIFGKFSITCFFNVIFMFTPEIFPTVLRSAGNGSCKSIPRIGSMLAPYSRPLFVVAQWAPGLIFTTLCFLGLFLSFFLPETKDRILPTKLGDIENDKTIESQKNGFFHA